MSSALCACGHERRDHIYEEGACRPGFVCPDGCKEYRPMTAPSTGAKWTCPDCDGEFPTDHPAVRALIAEAVQAERERIATVIETAHRTADRCDCTYMVAARIARGGGR